MPYHHKPRKVSVAEYFHKEAEYLFAIAEFHNVVPTDPKQEDAIYDMFLPEKGDWGVVREFSLVERTMHQVMITLFAAEIARSS